MSNTDITKYQEVDSSAREGLAIPASYKTQHTPSHKNKHHAYINILTRCLTYNNHLNYDLFMLANLCPVLNIPANGALVCNNWKTDYGQICILFCENSYTVPRGVDADDFYICGASGSWNPKNIMPDCSG
jgi:hypothetical protein